jgi:predicted permease
MWERIFLERFWQDLRYAARMLRRAPAFTGVVMLSLALGIGANSAIFTLMDHVMLRQVPVREPNRLVELLHRFPGEPPLNGFVVRSWRFFQANNHVFSDILGIGNPGNWPPWSFAVKTDGSNSEWVAGVYVTGNYFDVLGVKPILGRMIVPQDSLPAAPGKVAVISWRYWKDRFHGDLSLPGKRVVVDDEPATIVGVAPPGFAGLHIEKPEDIWVSWASDKRAGGLALVGRLKPGVGMERARAELAVLWDQTAVRDPNAGPRKELLQAMRFELASAAHGLTGVPSGGGLSSVHEAYGKPLVVLMAVVGLLLLVACTNIGSLLLARAAGRQHEMALRVSLGAPRPRLVRQALTESLLLAFAGALPGFGLAWAGTAVLLRILASGRDPINMRIAPDARVLLFAIALTGLTGVMFGLVPAIRACAAAPADALRGGVRTGDTRRQNLFGRSLVMAQVAFSLLLLSAAGMFVTHLASLYAGLGFQRDHVLLMTLDPSHSGYRREQLVEPYRQLLDRLAAIPGVRSATLSGVTPILGAGANRDATVEGYQPAPGELRYLMENWVAPRYFETLGQMLLAGRDFSFQDAGRPRVAIVNETMARHYFGGANPLGKHVLFDGDTQPYEIIGVVADAKYRDAKEPPWSTIYLNAFQTRVYDGFSLRTSGPPAGVSAAARRAVAETLPSVSVRRITTLADQVDASIVPERLVVSVSSLFGLLGAVLAAIGIYGLLAYTVARRTNEIGVRIALGATGGDVAGMVLRDALVTVIAGLAIGIPAALAARSVARSLIADLHVSVAPALAFGAAAMIVVALVAAWFPARRAVRVDPMVALRHE